MDTRLFRKASIDRLSSPEELDQILKISHGGMWATLVAILMICSAASVWAVKGTVATTASGTAMIVRPRGVITIVSRGAGAVQSIDVTVGERVRANQVIATIAQPSLAEKLRGLSASLTDLERKRTQDLKVKSDEVRMRLDAIQGIRVNTQRSIVEIEEMTKWAGAQVTAMEQLFESGLVAKPQVITAQQNLVQLRSQAEDRRAQLKHLDAQVVELQSQIATIDSDMRLRIADKTREIATVRSELSLLETVASPYAGVVVEIKVSPGGSVEAAGPVISLQPDSDTLEALVYVSALQAKDVQPGMDARVSPSTVKREEYGFMRGKVTFVADYPATSAALMRNFQNEQLVSSIVDQGPVTEIRVTLVRDPKAASGFEWSSPGGPPVTISAGTLGVAEIVTRNRAPITLVIPLLREQLGMR